MALYHHGENQVEFVPSCPTSRDLRPVPEDADLEGVLLGYPNISRAPFTNLVAFKRICFARSKRLVDGTQIPQYLAFTSVSQESLDEIDRIRDERRGRLPRMTILYDGREEILIVKLIDGVMHESAACQFASIFDLKLALLGVRTSIIATGSARFGRPAGRSKEANVSYKPISRVMEDEWPSFVIEVGVSQSLAMLRRDAAFWITNSDQRTRIVIVLSINRRDRQILVERWEEVPKRRPNRSTANYSRIPGLMQSLTLNADVEYDGPSLEIPAEKLFDRLPQNIPEGEFLLTPDKLNVFNTTFGKHSDNACNELALTLWVARASHNWTRLEYSRLCDKINTLVKSCPWILIQKASPVSCTYKSYCSNTSCQNFAKNHIQMIFLCLEKQLHADLCDTFAL